jgi:carbon storage regulator
MLVLSRKVGEQLVVGDNIRIVVHRVAGNRVTIGIEAPSDIRIIRGELEVHPNYQEHEAESYARGNTVVATLPRRAR